MALTVSDKAAVEVKKVMQDQNMALDANVLRVGVVGGGCSGFQYSMSFAKKEDVDALNDLVYQAGDLTYVVDRKSDVYLEATTVDFHDGIERRGFVFNNPQATRTCGCGSSFS